MYDVVGGPNNARQVGNGKQGKIEGKKRLSKADEEVKGQTREERREEKAQAREEGREEKGRRRTKGTKGKGQGRCCKAEWTQIIAAVL